MTGGVDCNLEGRVALVTGGGRGIGRACTLALAGAGASVIAVARSAGDLEAVVASSKRRVSPWSMDVTSDAFVERLLALPRLDILVNNAGMNRPLPMVDVDSGTLDAMIALNIRAAYRTAQAAAKVMMRSGQRGSVIHMSSQMGHVGAPLRTVYCMTKHAIEGLTKAMAVELGPAGIRVNSIAPTFVETDLTRPMFQDPAFLRSVIDSIPLARIGRPEDIAAGVLFLASDASAMITGHSLLIDGGWTAR
jgi:NAD(P)-dependent dehydrogenase (short-subunit alcohol dehydrogenase family)